MFLITNVTKQSEEIYLRFRKKSTIDFHKQILQIHEEHIFM